MLLHPLTTHKCFFAADCRRSRQATLVKYLEIEAPRLSLKEADDEKTGCPGDGVAVRKNCDRGVEVKPKFLFFVSSVSYDADT